MLRTFDDLGFRQEPRFHLELGLLKLVHLQRLLPVEDLLSQLQDRLAPDGEAARYLIDVILKAEEFKKQKMPVSVVLMDSRARILKERLVLLKTAISAQLSGAENDSEAMALQSRIVELTQLDTVVLSKVETLEDIEKVKDKLDAIESAHNQTTKMETRV